ncbi:Acid phosphatase [Neolecta irregularis DAH-3]|uniref:Acid phosphatase n=1 Tax=Neolecta irregularis (strain DAH-3) TaxID=1198029 RepID=A0A1U7LRK8_NEOID|nr:Acid phosphatase [Neolecta irregularis DAH-3]|eukprot:OLL25258.1 Acid phosphatase [Neolecta irregularis DAH-3]
MLFFKIFSRLAGFSSSNKYNRKFVVEEQLGNLTPYTKAPLPEGILFDKLPDTCSVVQASLLTRHGSRNPIISDARPIIRLKKILDDSTFPEELPPAWEFLRSWNNTLELNSLTAKGRKQSFVHGVNFRQTYNALYDPSENFTVVVGEKDRVIESAEWFRYGFFGKSVMDSSSSLLIPEENSVLSYITPSFSCPKWSYTDGLTAAANWSHIYLPPITQRINTLLPTFNFTDIDIQGMLFACPYELSRNGRSSFCSLFNPNEILDFQYQLDMLMYYATGYGLSDNLGPILGSYYVKELVNRLTKDAAEYTNSTSLFVDFGHDTSLDFFFSAMGFFKDEPQLSAFGPRNDTRLWRTNYQVPFAARVVTEKLLCEGELFVRIVLNGSPIRMPCSDAYGICKMVDFLNLTEWAVNVSQEDMRKICNH